MTFLADLKLYFQKYGSIRNCLIMIDNKTGNSRGFGFLVFDNESSVREVMKNKNFHQIKGKWIDCKRANPASSKKTIHPENSNYIHKNTNELNQKNKFNYQHSNTKDNKTNTSNRNIIMIESNAEIPTYIPKSFRNQTGNSNLINDEINNKNEYAFSEGYIPHRNNNLYNQYNTGISYQKQSEYIYNNNINNNNKQKDFDNISNNASSTSSINNYNYYNTNINNYIGIGICCNSQNGSNSSHIISKIPYSNYPHTQNHQNSYSLNNPPLCANCYSSMISQQFAHTQSQNSNRNYPVNSSYYLNPSLHNSITNQQEEHKKIYNINSSYLNSSGRIDNEKVADDLTNTGVRSQTENYFAYKFSNSAGEALRLDFNKPIIYTDDGHRKLFEINDEERRKYENARGNQDNDNYELNYRMKEDVSKDHYGPQRCKNISL